MVSATRSLRMVQVVFVVELFIRLGAERWQFFEGEEKWWSHGIWRAPGFEGLLDLLLFPDTPLNRLGSHFRIRPKPVAYEDSTQPPRPESQIGKTTGHCISIYIYICTCICTHVCMYKYIHMYVCMYVCKCMHVYVCMYMYVYMHVYIHIF